MTQRATNPRAGRVLRFVGFGCLAVGVTLLAGVFSSVREGVLSLGVTAGAFLVGVVVAGGGVLLQEYAKRLSAERFEPTDEGDTILYLRPFTADQGIYDVPEIGIRGGPLFLVEPRYRTLAWLFVNQITRTEELLAYAFRDVGTLTAVGNPNERLPPAGAARWYVAPDAGDPERPNWQGEVTDHMQRAEFTLLHTGSSPGLMWEVEAALQTLDPERLVLFIGPSGHRSLWGSMLAHASPEEAAAQAWTGFRDACGHLFPVELPEDIGRARLVEFDAGWNPLPREPVTTRLAWYLPGPRARFDRTSREGALAWLHWVLVPEPFGRELLRGLAAFVWLVPTLILGFLGLGVLGLLVAVVLESFGILGP